MKWQPEGRRYGALRAALAGKTVARRGGQASGEW